MPSQEGVGSDRSSARTRRRFVRRQWRRRFLAWKYVVALAAVVVVAVVAVWAIWFSSWLSVKGVDVQGGSFDVPPAGVRAAAKVPMGQALLTVDLGAIERRVETVMPAVQSVDVQGWNRDVSPASIRAAARVPMGGPLLTTDLGMIERRVETVIPAIKSVDVSREWPDKILIKVTERTPGAVIDEADGLHALDSQGQVFLTYKKPPKGLPVVESNSTDTNALAQGAQVAAALPSSLAPKVDHVQVYTADHIELALGDGRTIMWGSAADSGLKAQVLAALMRAQPGAHRYDVSVPGSPVAR